MAFQGINRFSSNLVEELTFSYPDGMLKDVISPLKELYKMHPNGQAKQMKSSLIFQMLDIDAINQWLLEDIVTFVKHCMQKENRCIFQMGYNEVLYYNSENLLQHL